MATNPGQDEQEAGSQGQEHQNDDEQRDVEASGSPGLEVERQLAIPERHAVTRTGAERSLLELGERVCGVGA